MAKLILVVEDEREFAESVAYRLHKEGFRTRLAETGVAALAAAQAEPHPDLVLLDLMLPDLSGTEICRRLRADAQTAQMPILMLTAKGEEIDRVVGFEVGADDYLVKPCSLAELVLRIRAILRRSGGNPTVAAEVSTFGRLRIDAPGHRAWIDDQELILTALEFKLLLTLLDRRGRVQSRDQLLEAVWGFDASISTRTVDTHVKRLRLKLGDINHYIETLRGVGYRLRERPED